MKAKTQTGWIWPPHRDLTPIVPTTSDLHQKIPTLISAGLPNGPQWAKTPPKFKGPKGLPITKIMLRVALGSSLGSRLVNMPLGINTRTKNKGTMGDCHRKIMSKAANTNLTNPT